MEDYRYIVATVAGIIYLVLLIYFICLGVSSRKKRKAQEAEMDAYYSDKSLPKMEYDVGIYEGGLTVFEDYRNETVSYAEYVNAPSGSIVRLNADETEEIVGTYVEKKP